MISQLTTLNTDLAALVTTIRPGVVQLSNGPRGQGAGTIWRGDGLIVSNAHVVQRRAPRVTLADGRELPSHLIAVDEKRDLALLRVDTADLPAIPPGDSRALRPGEWVLALGHPWGVVGAVSAGTVIAVGVPLEMPHYRGELLQANLQLRPGHSGGPMVDGNGRLVGINTMLAGPYAGLAIPVHVVQAFVRQAVGATEPAYV
ncbi:MAG: trypsin-like peptidase domain-containing protein [Anaerolineales bacterium]|nr:trypsin-like peptidase domain-containing protein [Anaerolineales bacterium]